jgi:hypothetical protein
LISADQEYLSNILWQAPQDGGAGITPVFPLICEIPIKKNLGVKALQKIRQEFYQKFENNEFSTIYYKVNLMKMLKILNPEKKVGRTVKLVISENQLKTLISKLNEQPLKQLKK